MLTTRLTTRLITLADLKAHRKARQMVGLSTRLTRGLSWRLSRGLAGRLATRMATRLRKCFPDGSPEDWPLGFAVGRPVGSPLDFPDGWLEGCPEGSQLGWPEGCPEDRQYKESKVGEYSNTFGNTILDVLYFLRMCIPWIALTEPLWSGTPSVFFSNTLRLLDFLLTLPLCFLHNTLHLLFFLL